ncbi:MAG: hypothetical protein ACYDA4_11380 [Ignavibacteriaceae bacterium]
MHKNQPLFSNILEIMIVNGFELFDLRPVYWNTIENKNFSKGQLIWADALFIRKYDSLINFLKRNFSDVIIMEKITKYFIILLFYGYDDFIYYYLKNSPISLDILFQDFETLIKKCKEIPGIKFKGKYYLTKFIEKLLKIIEPSLNYNLYQWDKFTLVGKYLGTHYKLFN